MFGRKRRILRKAIKHEMELMEKLRNDCRLRKIPKVECHQIELRWKDIAELLNKIMPPEPLTRQQIILRALIVFFGFFSLTSVVGFYIKEAYFPHDSVTYTSIEGDALEYRYVPEERVVVSEFTDVNVVSTSDNVDVLRTEDVNGTMVELIPREDVLELYYTHLTDTGQRPLFAMNLPHDFHTTKTFEEKAVVSGYDFVDASIVALPSGYLLAGAVLEQGVSHLMLARFDQDWQLVGDPTYLDWLDPKETGVGVLLEPIYATAEQTEIKGFYLLTTLLQEQEASVLDRTVPILREFDVNLHLVRAQKLDAKQLSLDTHMGLHPLANGGFYVLTNGKNPITAGTMSGDDLFLLSYDEQWELLRIVQLTTNGTPHDFHPSRILELAENMLLIPYQQIQRLPQAEGEETGYANETGKAFVMALKGIEKVVGTIFAADYSVRPNDGEPLIGARNSHIARWGDRLFVAHDFLVEEDEIDLGEGGDGAYRMIRVGWWKISY